MRLATEFRLRRALAATWRPRRAASVARLSMSTIGDCERQVRAALAGFQLSRRAHSPPALRSGARSPAHEQQVGSNAQAPSNHRHAGLRVSSSDHGWRRTAGQREQRHDQHGQLSGHRRRPQRCEPNGAPSRSDSTSSICPYSMPPALTLSRLSPPWGMTPARSTTGERDPRRRRGSRLRRPTPECPALQRRRRHCSTAAVWRRTTGTTYSGGPVRSRARTDSGCHALSRPRFRTADRLTLSVNDTNLGDNAATCTSTHGSGGNRDARASSRGGRSWRLPDPTALECGRPAGSRQQLLGRSSYCNASTPQSSGPGLRYGGQQTSPSTRWWPASTSTRSGSSTRATKPTGSTTGSPSRAVAGELPVAASEWPAPGERRCLTIARINQGSLWRAARDQGLLGRPVVHRPDWTAGAWSTTVRSPARTSRSSVNDAQRQRPRPHLASPQQAMVADHCAR